MVASPRLPAHRRLARRFPTWRLAVAILVLAQQIWCAPALHAAATEVRAGLAVSDGYRVEYAVPNGPTNLAAEAPNRIWFVAPQSDGVGLMVVTSPLDESVIRYRAEFIGLAQGTEPYDLVLAGGVLWFTLRGAGQIGRLDTDTRALELIPVPAANSRPTGIDVDPDGQIWFADSSGRLGRLNPENNAITLFPFPPGIFPPSTVEDLRVQSRRDIWFTLPEGNAVGNFKPLTGRFFSVPTRQLGGAPGDLAVVEGPTQLAIDPSGPWVTAAKGSKVGKFAPSTLAQWFWYNTPTPDSGPTGILTFTAGSVREVWFTQSQARSVGRLQIVNGFDVQSQDEILLAAAPSQPTQMTLDADNNIWIADTTRNVIYELRPPYVYRKYFALVYP